MKSVANVPAQQSLQLRPPPSQQVILNHIQQAPTSPDNPVAAAHILNGALEQVRTVTQGSAPNEVATSNETPRNNENAGSGVGDTGAEQVLEGAQVAVQPSSEMHTREKIEKLQSKYTYSLNRLRPIIDHMQSKRPPHQQKEFQTRLDYCFKLLGVAPTQQLPRQVSMHALNTAEEFMQSVVRVYVHFLKDMIHVHGEASERRTELLGVVDSIAVAIDRETNLLTSAQHDDNGRLSTDQRTSPDIVGHGGANADETIAPATQQESAKDGDGTGNTVFEKDGGTAGPNGMDIVVPVAVLRDTADRLPGGVCSTEGPVWNKLRELKAKYYPFLEELQPILDGLNGGTSRNRERPSKLWNDCCTALNLMSDQRLPSELSLSTLEELDATLGDLLYITTKHQGNKLQKLASSNLAQMNGET